MWYVAEMCAVVVVSALAGFAENRYVEGSKAITSMNALTTASTPEALMTLFTAQINDLLVRLETK